MKRKSVMMLTLFVVLFGAVAAAWFCLGPKGTEGTKTITVQVEHISSAPAAYTFRTDAQYLRQALEEQDLIVGEESSYGLWILAVDGETADESRQQWWGYSVNGQYAEYGVESQPVTDGDVYEFVLHEGW